MSVLVERKSDSQGYVEETSVDGITVRSQGNDKDAPVSYTHLTLPTTERV